MTTSKLIDRLEKKGYPLWKIHSILSLFAVELRPIIDVEEFKYIEKSNAHQQALSDAEVYIESLDEWDKIK